MFFNKTQKKGIMDKDFFAADESSFMPKDKEDIDIIGKLDWSSSDSEKEDVYKDTRIDFLIKMNCYMERTQGKFDEMKRMEQVIFFFISVNV